jgi:hypothetical protein
MELTIGNFNFPGFYRGKVVDNNDPDKLGRIKVTIGGILEDTIEVGNLPWATPAFPISYGSGSGFGSFAVPMVDSWVWVFFENGSHVQPVFFAEAADGIHGLPTEKNSNYPNKRVIKSKNGIVISVDDTDLEIKLTHPTGKYIKMDKTGAIIISAGNIEITGETVTISADKIEMNP